MDMNAQVKRRMLLLVEDEPDLSEELAELLELKGFSVRTADCVVAAVAALPFLTAPASILTDLRLPDGSGLDLIHEVCNRPEVRSRVSHMALMTGHTDLTERVRLEAERLRVPLLFKPLPISALLPLLGAARLPG